jgi:hypothetical protein
VGGAGEPVGIGLGLQGAAVVGSEVGGGVELDQHA